MEDRKLKKKKKRKRKKRSGFKIKFKQLTMISNEKKIFDFLLYYFWNSPMSVWKKTKSSEKKGAAQMKRNNKYKLI